MFKKGDKVVRIRKDFVNKFSTILIGNVYTVDKVTTHGEGVTLLEEPHLNLRSLNFELYENPLDDTDIFDKISKL